MSFTRVKMAQKITDNCYYAIKIFKHSNPKLNVEGIKREITALSALENPHIVKIIEFAESIDYIKKNGTTYKVVAIVLELIHGGELYEYVKWAGRFSESVARTYFKTLIESNYYFFLIKKNSSLVTWLATIFIFKILFVYLFISLKNIF